MNFVDLQGLGRFDSFDYDLSIRVLLDTLKSNESALRVEPMVEFSSPVVDLEKCYVGETYSVPFNIVNEGAAPAELGPLLISGDSFRALSQPDILGCGETFSPDIRFRPDEMGEYGSSVGLEVIPTNYPMLNAEINGSVVGYSVRGDSMEVPGRVLSYADSARGGVSFKMQGEGLITGVRTYLHQPFSRVRWKLWSRIEPFSGVPRVLITRSEADTLLAGPGWVQLFFDTPALADSGVNLVAEVEYISAGTELYVPLDTLRPNGADLEGMVSLFGRNSLNRAGNPVAVHPLIEPSDNSLSYPQTVFIRPDPEVRTPTSA